MVRSSTNREVFAAVALSASDFSPMGTCQSAVGSFVSKVVCCKRKRFCFKLDAL